MMGMLYFSEEINEDMNCLSKKQLYFHFLILYR